VPPNIPTTTAVWPPIWQKLNTHDLPIQTVLSPSYYNNETTIAAITALYSPASNQSDFALLLPARQHTHTPTELTVPTCSLQIHRNSHRPSNFILMTEWSRSMATGPPTGTAPLQQDYYVPWHQPEHHQTDLLPFTADLNKYPTINSTTNHLIQHSATLLYSMIRFVPTLTAIATKAYLPALATEFQIGPRRRITRSHGNCTDTPLPATSDKNLLRLP